MSAVELAQVIIALPKGDAELDMLVGHEDNILMKLLQMLPKYPWNNFLQLRVREIFEGLLKGTKLTKDQKWRVIKGSNITEILSVIGHSAYFSFNPTQNKTRIGYMGIVIKLSLVMKEFQIVDEFDDCEGVSDVFNEQWELYLNDEVEKSVKNDLTTLGGASKANADMSDDEPAQFDDNMESIMGRFNSFNSLMSSNNTNDDDDDREENNDDEV